MNQIEEKLYLGCFAATKNCKVLEGFNITHIITVNERRLSKQVFKKCGIQLKHILASDMPNENLLIHFDDAIEYINNAMCKGAVLVHCTLGISRSATLVIAYLMKKHNLCYNDAFEQVKSKRPIIRPNPGFISQLLLYHEMSYTVDKSLQSYKQFQLYLAAYAMKQMKRLPLSYQVLINSDPGKSGSYEVLGKTYRCKRCKRLLASEVNLLHHKDHTDCKTDCNVMQSHFVEPLGWMKAIHHNMKGTLSCPDCRHSVGLFSWVTGQKCACGRPIVPAFVLTEVIS